MGYMNNLSFVSLKICCFINDSMGQWFQMMFPVPLWSASLAFHCPLKIHWSFTDNILIK